MDTNTAPLVLIVEDDVTIARLIDMLLRMHGYHTLIAADADTAIRHLQSVQPALLTLDLNLGGISGETLLGLIRATPETADLPVVIVSAYPEIGAELRAQAEAVITKPFELEDLLAAVRAVAEPAPQLAAQAVGS